VCFVSHNLHVLSTTLLTVVGIVGLSSSNRMIIDLAYDVLGLEALFLVPRIFSLLSLNPYFGTLVSQMCSDRPFSFNAS
jgi:hypothetical protein